MGTRAPHRAPRPQRGEASVTCWRWPSSLGPCCRFLADHGQALEERVVDCKDLTGGGGGKESVRRRASAVPERPAGAHRRALERRSSFALAAQARRPRPAGQPRLTGVHDGAARTQVGGDDPAVAVGVACAQRRAAASRGPVISRKLHLQGPGLARGGLHPRGVGTAQAGLQACHPQALHHAPADLRKAAERR